MRITSVNQIKHSGNTCSLADEWSRLFVCKILEKISIGCLVIEDQGQISHFGQRKDKAEIVANISVKDCKAWARVLKEGSVGAGEAYMQGLWDSPDLIKVVRLMVLNMNVLQSMGKNQSILSKCLSKAFHFSRRNTKVKAKHNISAHYDLNNDFFSLFLDKTMAYSSAIFTNHDDSLVSASLRKFDHICSRLQLKPSDELLEIGTGWGGLAIHAAKHYGCKVTTTTLSHEQYLYAKKWVQEEGLSDRVTLLEKDYRDLDEDMTGQFDKLVSIEMIEAVGARYYSQYFHQCNRLLKDDGLMLIQAITISDQRYSQSVNSIDFIKRYIFPGGQLPSNSVVASNLAEFTNMQLIGLEDITLDYARTLKEWRKAFWQNMDKVKEQGADEAFIRMWHYYLCFCEGGFRERVIHTAQFLMAKPKFRSLPSIQ